MCWRLEFNGSTKEANNKLTVPRLILNIIGVFIILCLGTAMALVANYAQEWFPTYRGYDGVYKRITSDDSRSMNLTNSTLEDCTNSNEIRRFIGRIVYKCGEDSKSLCIPMDQRCDGYKDCGDNSDESGCGVDEYFCDSAISAGVRFSCKVYDTTANKTVERCMLTDYKCDGQLDCTGTGLTVTDESECKETFSVGGIKCGVDNNWVCKDQLTCVRLEDRCNGYNNCWDGSDEEGCPEL